VPNPLDLTQALSRQPNLTGPGAPPSQIGRYQVISTLGSGNMGAVYLALDPLIGRTVAIKVIPRDRYSQQSEQFESCFRREVQAIGQLMHPNIVTIHDAELTDTTAYFAMEYIKGETLREILDGGIKLPLDHVRNIIGQVAEGLQHAHQHNIVHRDIKPANIIVAPNGTAKIMDFGIALSPSTDLVAESVQVGTPRYMSPEQFLNRPPDNRVDIYALGAVLYELLTGVPPFDAESLQSLRDKILHQEPVPPSRLNLHLNDSYDRIVARALSKEPEARYQDIRELAMDVMRASKPGLTWSKAQYDLETISVRHLLSRLLKSVWLFKGFRMDEMVECLLHTEKTVAFPDQEIIREGSPGEFVYILVAGRVAVIKETPGSAGQVLATLEPGQSFGEMSLVENSPCSASVRALEECTLLRISQADFWKMPGVSAKLYKNIAGLLSSRLRHSNELLSMVMKDEE